MSTETPLIAYLKADRQWPRLHRIAHAQYQLSQAVEPKERAFWRAVIKRNAWSSQDDVRS